jgi:hypothetical protein
MDRCPLLLLGALTVQQQFQRLRSSRTYLLGLLQMLRLRESLILLQIAQMMTISLQ